MVSNHHDHQYGVKPQSTNVIMLHYFEQASLESIWKRKVEKSLGNATLAFLHYFEQMNPESTWKRTEKVQINATSVIMHLVERAIGESI